MPPRKTPYSGKKKKEYLALKRAAKAGGKPDLDRSDRKKLLRRKRDASVGSTVEAARKLQSAFMKLSVEFLREADLLASTLTLKRPIPIDAAVLHPSWTTAEAHQSDPLTCPRRPKWRFDMSKLEVERNEEGAYKKWLSQTDDLVAAWQLARQETLTEAGETRDEMPPSPTNFERNIEVWRQLWRVTEISDIILVLLDSRCPLLHYPPSLNAYLTGHKVILVLTKVDITGPHRAKAWSDYIHKEYPGLPVVHVESYREKATRSNQQGKQHYEPHIPENFRQRLVSAIKGVYDELLEPPEKVKNNPEWLKKWSPPVRKNIDWDLVLNAAGTKVGSAVGGAAVPRATYSENEGIEHQGQKDQEFLTIGLIGQPNVGKSSLLNALFETRRVTTSKTPGKTKHFQTLYWTPDVRLVDCPGLVMPNYVPLEMQVLCGILPISRVSAVPSCIYFASRLLPLELIYKLGTPTAEDALGDKRTWRPGMQKNNAKEDVKLEWTAMDILASYANVKDWKTARAGRPDLHRAGNAVLRALAEGDILWAFWPPGTSSEYITQSDGGKGIWIPRDNWEDGYPEPDSESDEEHDIYEDIGSQEELSGNDGSDKETVDSQESISEDARGTRNRYETGTRFDALLFDDEEQT